MLTWIGDLLLKLLSITKPSTPTMDPRLIEAKEDIKDKKQTIKYLTVALILVGIWALIMTGIVVEIIAHNTIE